MAARNMYRIEINIHNKLCVNLVIYKVHQHVHNSPPLLPTLSQNYLCTLSHTITSRFILILPSHLRLSSKWSLSFRCPHLHPVKHVSFPHMCHMPLPSLSSRFDTLITTTINNLLHLPSTCETKFHTHIKSRQTQEFCVHQPLYF